MRLVALGFQCICVVKQTEKMGKKTKIAFIHRYGLEGWICCGGHAIPGIIEQLSADVEIHFYGPHTTEQKDPALRSRLWTHTWASLKALEFSQHLCHVDGYVRIGSS